MIALFYFVVFILSLVMTGRFIIRNKKADTAFVLFGLLVTINCFGRYTISVSQSLEMALWANKFLYVGACFAPLVLNIILARLCNIKIPQIPAAVMALYSAVMMGLVLSIGHSDLYYKSVELVVTDGYSYLDKVYGPLHILYPIMMTIYLGIMIFYIIYALRRKQSVSVTAVGLVSSIGFMVMALYILERIIDANVSIVAVGYLVGMLLLIRYFERMNMYDISSNIVRSVENMKEYGYIVFDNKLRFVNANDYIREVFPEINSWQVDKEVCYSDSYFYKEVVRYVIDWNGDEKTGKIINAGERFFELHIRRISYGEKQNIGLLLEFADRTLERKYYNAIEDYNVSLEKQVAEKTEHILYIKDMMVLGMAEMVESRDDNTGGHIKRTSGVVKVFSQHLADCCGKFGIDERFLQQVEKAAPMHDLGKIAIEDAVLRKPGRFTNEEFDEMKCHAAEGARIVENILRGVEDDDFVEIAKNVAHYHHEKWNGTGYPTGISGTDIPIEARIMALADVFDALVSKRCYKEAFSYDEVFGIIEKSLGEHFDPELGRVFLECRDDLKEFYRKCR